MDHQRTARELLSALHYSATVKGHTFDGQDLTTVRTPELVWFDRCSFIGTDLRHATLDGCRFKMCSFQGANLRGASLRGAAFSSCDLRDADLRDTDLTGSHFSYSNSGPQPVRTDITGADLTGACLRDVQADQVIGWTE